MLRDINWCPWHVWKAAWAVRCAERVRLFVKRGSRSVKMSLFRREGLPSLYMHRVWLTRHVTTNVTTLASVVFSPEGKNIVSGSYDQTIKESLGCRCQHALTPQTLGPNLTAPVFVAASMELKAEKRRAHSDCVSSVAFSPDGKTIVSGSRDKTIKVWDAGVSTDTLQPLAQT